jgi:hypothetical protein
MAVVIWKKELKVETINKVELPVNSLILGVTVSLTKFGLLKPHLYFMTNNDVTINDTRTIVTVGTGEAIENSQSLRFIDSYSLKGGEFVAHVFEQTT